MLSRQLRKLTSKIGAKAGPIPGRNPPASNRPHPPRTSRQSSRPRPRVPRPVQLTRPPLHRTVPTRRRNGNGPHGRQDLRPLAPRRLQRIWTMQTASLDLQMDRQEEEIKKYLYADRSRNLYHRGLHDLGQHRKSAPAHAAPRRSLKTLQEAKNTVLDPRNQQHPKFCETTLKQPNRRSRKPTNRSRSKNYETTPIRLTRPRKGTSSNPASQRRKPSVSPRKPGPHQLVQPHRYLKSE